MSKFPGFDGLRLLAASTVIFSHAFLIALGSGNHGPLITGLETIGVFGVYTFFIISGFLLAHAYDRDPNAIRFAINRVLRIYPGFGFCVAITALVLGPLAGAADWQAYFSSPLVASYVTTGLSCLCDSTLPEAFAYVDLNHLERVVNGSLWSLSYEVRTYVLFLCLLLALRNVDFTAVSLTLIAAASMMFPAVRDSMPGIMYLLPFFACGVLMYSISRRVALTWQIAAACAVAFVAFAGFGSPTYAFAPFGAYVIVWLGTKPNVGSALAARVGDLSYGAYLFGWPVEQLVKQYTQTTNPWVLMMIAIPLVLAIAAFSYHLVELPALRLKKPLGAHVAGALRIANPQTRRVVYSSAVIGMWITTLAIMTSAKHWWFVTRSLAEVAASAALAALIGLVVVSIARRWNRSGKHASSAINVKHKGLQ